MVRKPPAAPRTQPPLLPGLADLPEPLAPGPAAPTVLDWLDRIVPLLDTITPAAWPVAEAGLRAHPAEPALLASAAIAALLADRPDRAIGLLKRFERKYGQDPAITLLSAIALAHQGHVAHAAQLQAPLPADTGLTVIRRLGAGRTLLTWLTAQRARIRPANGKAARPGTPTIPVNSRAPAAGPGQMAGRGRTAAAGAAAARLAKAPKVGTAPGTATPGPGRPSAAGAPVSPSSAPPPRPAIPALPRLEVPLSLTFDFAAADLPPAAAAAPHDPTWFGLRAELAQLGLVEGFDELLCLPTLTGVEAHWYQIETVRKVLKQYRGRVLLADEVGLGKTVEAGMVVKEYMLRGMADRLLVLAPAALVGQWREEMAQKFSIDCATTHDPLFRADPDAFWAQPRLIASIAGARRKEHAERLALHTFDVVVVDEAHHLRDQASASYRLVGALQKRFLLLLSATPVQNNLIELYNLLTLLQPGIFRTPKDFRAAYMVPGKPREPANRDRLRDLMRGVMVRNTRALAALRMPRRHASTIRVTPGPAEAACYEDLTAMVRRAAQDGQARLAVQHLLAAAGSSPAAAAAALARFAERHPGAQGWAALRQRYRAIGAGAKQDALIRLLAQNPAEKKLVFIHHRDSMTQLAGLLRARGLDPLVFDGSMSGPEKDEAVAGFRDRASLLLCSESGGEGRNLQFCNTLINFDIPWNPMAIEQRIGRIDRLGQTREVFVFNLVAAGTIEDAMLRILDEKINMFELVVGEVGAILGEIDDQVEFSSLVLDAWLQTTQEARALAFAALEKQVLEAQRQYEDAKQLDDALFGNDLDAA